MSEPPPITGIEEIRAAIHTEQKRAQRAGSAAAPRFFSPVRRASRRQRFMNMIRGLPLLGRVGRWAYGLTMAPARIRDLLTLIRLAEEEAARARLERQEMAAAHERDLAAARRHFQDELHHLGQVSAGMETALAGVRQALAEGEVDLAQLKGRVAAVVRQVDDLDRGLAAAETGLGAMQSEVAGMRQPLDMMRREQEEERRQAEALGEIYPRLESHFRGSQDLVRERQRIYLPYLVEAGLAERGLPVLDLGCGRGEWLELLVENGFAGRGVEQNRELATACRDRGLTVQEGEAGLVLSQLEAGSVGAVTAFHLLEHLPFARWLALVREAARVLVPGGLVLFETPNPENLLVSGGDFFLDPTHVRPIPNQLLCYVARAEGLARCQVLQLHPRGGGMEGDGGSAGPLLDRHLLGPQDYAVIAWKD